MARGNRRLGHVVLAALSATLLSGCKTVMRGVLSVLPEWAQGVVAVVLIGGIGLVGIWVLITLVRHVLWSRRHARGLMEEALGDPVGPPAAAEKPDHEQAPRS